MATIEGLPDGTREFVKAYGWQRIDPTPWAEVRRPPAESRVGLVVMACETLPEQPPFQAEQPGNDPSIRIVPADTDPRTLVNTFAGQGFDHAGLFADPNLLVPLDRLREMTGLGEIAGLTERVVSLCGHLPKPRRLMDETAPEIARIFREDGADAVLLVPA